MKICPVGAELFHVNRRTYMMKFNSHFTILWMHQKNRKNLTFVRTFLEGWVCGSNYWDVNGVIKIGNVLLLELEIW